MNCKLCHNNMEKENTSVLNKTVEGAKTNECRVLSETQNLSPEEVKPKHGDTLDLLLEFVSSLMERDYCTSLQLCKQVLDREPWNKLALQFLPLLLRKCSEERDQMATASEFENSNVSGSDSSSSRSIRSESSDSSATDSSLPSSGSSDDNSVSEDSSDSDSSESDPGNDIEVYSRE